MTISKSQIETLVKNGAIENTLQKELKKDLSIFAELYAYPAKEYICFSEFPVGDTGNVDFVVFTGRSRMKVYLIEIKGADFNIVNQSRKDWTFNAGFVEGIDQIIKRMRYINDHYSEFREFVHKVRRNVVEYGEKEYNSLPGPLGLPEAASDKDIVVHGVVIGGVTVKDHEESSKRNQWEKSFSFPLRLESWDSWLKQVERS